MATPNIVPRSDSEGQLGTSSKYWGAAYIDAIYVGAGTIGRDADNLLDFSADNHLTLRLNANNKLVFDGARMYPNSNDGYGLGLASNSFSDLFLASGAVINFDNGNVTLTHSSNALTLADNDKFQLGTGGDLQIYHNSSNDRGYIYNATGDLYIENDATDGDIKFFSDDGSGGTTEYFKLDGANTRTKFSKTLNLQDNVDLYLGTSSDLRLVHNGSDSVISNSTGDVYIVNNADDKDIIFQSDDGSGGVTAYLTLDGGNTDIDFHKNAHFLDNVNVKIGSATGGDLQLYHNGSHSLMSNQTGNLLIRSETADGDISFIADNGQSNGSSATYFFLDGSSATHDGSATTALYTNWPDKSRISLGTSHDLQISHDGANSYVENITNDLVFINYADDKDIIFKASTGSASAATYMTLDGSTKTLEVSVPLTVGADDTGYDVIFYGATSGAYLQWDESQDRLELRDNVQIAWGNGIDLTIKHDGTNSKVTNSSGNLEVIQNVDDGDIIFKSDDGSGGVTAYLTLDGSASTVNFGRHTFQPDGIEGRFGTDNDLKIYHDGSNSYIQASGTGDIIVEQRNDDKDIVFNCDDGSGGTSEYFRLDGSQATHDGSATTSLITQWPDNSRIYVGSGQDGRFYHDGSNTYLQNTTGDLIIQNFADDGDIIFKSDDGSGGTETYFFLDGSSGGGAPFTQFPDGSVISMGTSQDLKIQHDGSNSYIESTTSNLYIKQSYDDGNIFFQSDNGSGGTETYFHLNGSTGYTEFSNNTHFTDNVQAWFGNSGDLKIYHDGSNSFIANTTGVLTVSNTGGGYTVDAGGDINLDAGGNDIVLKAAGSEFARLTNSSQDFIIENTNNDKDIIFKSDDGSGSTTAYITLDGSDVATVISTVKIMMPNLPSSDPGVTGQLWNDSGTLKIS